MTNDESHTMRISLIAFCLLFAAAAVAEAQEYIVTPLEDGDPEHYFDAQNQRILTRRFKIYRQSDKEVADEVEESWIHVYESDKLVEKVKLVKKPVDLRWNIVIVLDVSGSMKAKASDKDNKTKIDALHEAATAFIEKLPPKARVTLLPFSDTIDTPEPFTDRKPDLAAAIRKLKPRGGTLLYDAIYNGVETLMADRHTGRRAVIVLTDGKDEEPGSRHAPAEVIELAREAKVPLYLIGLGKPHEINEPIMSELADQTKGTYQRAEDQKKLHKYFEDLANEFPEEEFVIDITSLQQVTDGTRRPLRVAIFRDGKQVSNDAKGTSVVRGVVLPELDMWVYLPLLAVLTGLLVLPYTLARLAKSSTSRSS